MDRLSSDVASVVEVAFQAAVSVFRDVLVKEAPNLEWKESNFTQIREIERCLVCQIQKVFTEVSSDLIEEIEALRAKVEQLEDVLQKKAGQLEQELEARVGQLGREMEQLEQELKSFSHSTSNGKRGIAHIVVPDVALVGEGKVPQFHQLGNDPMNLTSQS